MQELLFHYSLGQQNYSSAILFHSLNELSERLDRIEALLVKRQRSDRHQLKEVKRAMLSKVENQLNHLEKTHQATITDLTTEVKAVKQVLENAKSKFIGFQ
jgi:TPP-dependent pyruvate/acetoin dehydrogenase alpha subunit